MKVPGLTPDEQAKLDRILEIFEREGVVLIPVKEDGTPETVQ